MTTDSRLARDVRFLKGYAIVSTALFAALALSAFRQGEKKVFDEIDVQRLNIVEKSGQVRLIIANKERTPGPIEKNVPFGYGPGTRTGLIFFSEEGTEVGGLIFGASKSADGKISAGGSLTFDQYGQDQTVALQYNENNGRRRSGLAINDLPTDISSREYDIKRKEMQKMSDTVARRMALDSLRRRYPFTGRAYFGKNLDGASVVTLADARGRTRLRLVVDSAGPAKIEFVDENGRVTTRLPNP
jgi:hypothetical protein